MGLKLGLGLHCLPPPRLHDYYDCYDDLYTAILLYCYTTILLYYYDYLAEDHVLAVEPRLAGGRCEVWEVGGGRWEV